MKVFIRLIKYIRYRWGQFLIGTILSVASAGLAIYGPMIASRLIDRVADGAKSGQMLSLKALWPDLFFYFMIMSVGILLAYASFLILARSSNAISKMIRDQAHQHMQRLPISFFDDKPAGKISARIVNDTETLLQNFYMNFMNQILLNLVMVVGTYIALYSVSPQIGLTLLVLLPIIVIWQWLYIKWVQPINLKWREIISQQNSQIAEMIHGISIVQLFQRQATVREEFAQTNQAWLKTRYDQINIETLLSWNFSELLRNLVIFAIMFYLGRQFTEGIFGYSVGTLYLLIEYTTRLFDPITMIVRLSSFVQLALAAGTRIFELLDTPLEEDADQEIRVDDGHIRFDSVSFAYNDDWVLQDLNFEVQPGQTVGLVGHTGSGKSSIINLLFRFYDPQKGQILIDGQAIDQYRRESLRQSMGIVLQEPYLFSGTIASNVSMNDPEIGPEKVVEALQQVGAIPLIDKLEKGIEEPVVEKGQSLSSGERQLISFARALACDPKILILDEATSHIDSETEDVIQHAMEVVKAGRTTLIVAHRLSTIQQADLILVLDQGRIIERGNHQELLAQGGQYAEMYHMQAQV
ncbi:ATP-binding cassette, subfamily B, tetracycline resistant protein [Ignavigranum ruoffiae]|uniref:ATP-binding cassette, subfamily B, tetracycline resistant protein n=1 Tax=Ignavigranum ruoffiae TaxID=89093 RepID=A0A1H8YW32_9LACT|nr:ABC transporter ATP-binding protein [Ignavigranum ruoffiae]SEP56400.1 ATP-binding cassette, subfamily B, tetracycline resistant protein [Ignavigranum ruoffiae]